MTGAACVGLGSAVGGIARWLLGEWMQRRFSIDTVALLEHRGWHAALLNVPSSVVLGVAGAAVGMGVGRMIWR